MKMKIMKIIMIITIIMMIIILIIILMIIMISSKFQSNIRLRYIGNVYYYYYE